MVGGAPYRGRESVFPLDSERGTVTKITDIPHIIDTKYNSTEISPLDRLNTISICLLSLSSNTLEDYPTGRVRLR